MNGERLKERRKANGYTVQQIADEMGVTRVSASRWESGMFEPDDETKKRLANLLGTTISYLMGETDDPNIPEQNDIDTKEYESESAKMFARLMTKLAKVSPDLVIHFRDLDNIEDLEEEDLQGLADGIAILTGKTNAEIEKRVRKQSRHGEL